jgi:ATP-dependent Lhr-like helicase
VACSGDFDADALYLELRRAGAYRSLARADFDACLDFCATGGYALSAYDRWHRLVRRADGRWGLRDPRTARRLRMNVGTIVAPDYMQVRMGRGRGGGAYLGEIEEEFVATLTPGDSFLFGGQVVRYERTHELTVQVSPSPSREPKIAVYYGTKLATSTLLSHRVVELLASPQRWPALPPAVRDWLELQDHYARLPTPGRLLVETFARGGRQFCVIYAFAGRNANQTLGLLVSQRMEEAGLAPQGFVANDYALMLWGLCELPDPAALLSAEGLTHGFEDWLAGNTVMKRTFRNVAIIAGLIERNMIGRRRTNRQTSFSSDILYDTLRRYDPGHLLLRITRDEALRGLVDFGRIKEMLARVQGRVDVTRADRVTPLAAPLLLEMGRVPLRGGSAEDLVLADQAALMAELLPEVAGE